MWFIGRSNLLNKLKNKALRNLIVLRDLKLAHLHWVMQLHSSKASKLFVTLLDFAYWVWIWNPKSLSLLTPLQASYVFLPERFQKWFVFLHFSYFTLLANGFSLSQMSICCFKLHFRNMFLLRCLHSNGFSSKSINIMGRSKRGMRIAVSGVEQMGQMGMMGTTGF